MKNTKMKCIATSMSRHKQTFEMVLPRLASQSNLTKGHNRPHEHTDLVTKRFRHSPLAFALKPKGKILMLAWPLCFDKLMVLLS